MGGSRKIAFGLGALATVAALALALLVGPYGAQATEQAGREGTFVGVATCGGTTCHGRSRADGAVVRQDEIQLWQDPATAAGAHSRAWAVLREPRSQEIARRLGIADAAAAPECTSCHSMGAAPTGTGTRFRMSEGVGCESCHGAASGWLSSHYAVGGTHQSSVARGLIPLENPRVRAGVCLDCHFGSAREGQFVTHRIMAAGHPRISFELDLFSTLQQHHDADADYRRRKGTIDGTRMWAIGQAIALDRALALFTTSRGLEGMFPEFYFFDCHSCHRQIFDDPQRRPTALANPGRPIPPGMPPFNDENMIMLSAAARIVAPQVAQRFERDSRAFHSAIASNRGDAIRAAQALRQSALALVEAFASAQMGPTATFAIIEAVTGNALRPRFTDYAGSVQAVMATDTLLSALVAGGHVSEAAANAIRVDISAAYRAVSDPNAYDPDAFRRSLGRAASGIRRLR